MAAIEPEDRYMKHYDAAEHWLLKSDEVASIEAARECVATAQVHATLAAAVAMKEMVDSYNGWKDLGK